MKLNIHFIRNEFSSIFKLSKQLLNNLIMKTQSSEFPIFTKPVIFFALLFLFSACADKADVQACVTAAPYGFLGGLWHGIIAPLSFFGSLFIDNVAMYAVNNNGGWYDFGFVLGAGILFGGGSRASKRK